MNLLNSTNAATISFVVVDFRDRFAANNKSRTRQIRFCSTFFNGCGDELQAKAGSGGKQLQITDLCLTG
jgi:hypothetical protein